MVKAMVSAAALLLAACETSGGGYAPQQQMDPNTRAMMFMYGMQQLQQSMQPPAAPQSQAIYCYGNGQGYLWCQ